MIPESFQFPEAFTAEKDYQLLPLSNFDLKQSCMITPPMDHIHNVFPLEITRDCIRLFKSHAYLLYQQKCRFVEGLLSPLLRK